VATPPLFHFLMMAAGRVVGFEIHKLRLLNMGLSCAAVIVLFRFLYRHAGLSIDRSLLFSLVFLLSPYFFGASFLLLTDNLGILFMLLSLTLLQEYAERRSVPFSSRDARPSRRRA
jgi:4-amino-4-deoxy-L-arabinose transferase-like glycosyltransferase